MGEGWARDGWAGRLAQAWKRSGKYGVGTYSVCSLFCRSSVSIQVHLFSVRYPSVRTQSNTCDMAILEGGGREEHSEPMARHGDQRDQRDEEEEEEEEDGDQRTLACIPTDM